MATVKESTKWLSYQGGFNVDADGSPNAYAPPPLKGLDFLANAGNAKTGWYGVVCDAKGNPVVQGPSDPAPGFYVSPTALGDHSKAATDPARYVDSSTVPYISVPKDLIKAGTVKLGDLAMVKNLSNGKASPAIVGDAGPAKKYGEGSIALAVALGLPSSPRNGGCSEGILYVVFKGTSEGWLNDFQDKCQPLLDAAGGWDAVR